jgi:hypothetical protein
MSERKRATHFALMDTAFPADRKFVRLAAKATIPIEYAAAVGVYWLILADCRRSKSGVVDWTEYAEYEPQIALLQSVGLLNANGFPQTSFDRWAPAYQSPWDATRRKGTQGTHRDDASIQFSSTQFPEGGAGGTVKGHMGQHPNCAVCKPLQAEPIERKSA